MRINFEVRRDGYIASRGVDYGNGRKPIEIWQSIPGTIEGMDVEAFTARTRRAPVVVMKMPGGSHWAGRGMAPGYHGAAFHVFTILSVTTRPSTDPVRFDMWCDEIIEFDIRKGV